MSEKNKIQDIRRDYTKDSIDIHNTPENPFEMFKKWFNEAIEENFYDPTAMILATATKEGIPSARTLLLKGYDETGFIFYTNYESKKGRELNENPFASILFYWDIMERQIRIDGKVEKISKDESYKYFKTRPRLSRLGAIASKQSNVLNSRFSLMRDVAVLGVRYPGDIPLPEHWGGYKLVPYSYEFWQGRKSRLHDRISYKLENEKWRKARLYP